MTKPTPDHPVAFFSAEYAIENNLLIYAGGLGVLSGDMVLEAGNEGVPMVAFGTMYAYGFDTAGDRNGRLDPTSAGFELLKNSHGETLTAQVVCNDRVVIVQGWQKHYGSSRLILLDTDNPNNNSEDAAITAQLYSTNYITKLCQEWVVGLAAVQFMRHLKIAPSVYHVNEGHTAFVIVGLLLDHISEHPRATLEQAREAVKEKVVATKHTILSGAGLFIDRLVFRSIAGAALQSINFDELFSLGTTRDRPEHFSTTKFILSHARKANGVSEIHVAKEKAEHPASRLIAVTNGVYRNRWMAQNLQEHSEPSDEDLWKIHSQNRGNLTATINDSIGSQLDPNALTVVWARRITVYKRPALLFNNLSRLETIVMDDDRPVQFILAGKANSEDSEAKLILEEILKYCRMPKLRGRVVYLPGYSVPTTRQLVAGADLWLNTPIRGQEACGTSGMKASMNGALQLSTRDGWIDEVHDDCLGWKLPEKDIETELYDTLEHKIVPLFYDRDESNLPKKWVKSMQESMKLIDERFTAKRMLGDYMTKMYFPNSRS